MPSKKGITMSRDADGFAVFTDGAYSIAVDGRFKPQEKAGAVAEAFAVKGGWKLDEAQTAVAMAIQEASDV